VVRSLVGIVLFKKAAFCAVPLALDAPPMIFFRLGRCAALGAGFCEADAHSPASFRSFHAFTPKAEAILQSGFIVVAP